MNDGGKDQRPAGRDEMNLCEFPITLVAERVPKGCKTLTFEGQHGKLTVTGSDAYGLPTATDSDVIILLIQLTKLRNDFTNPTVPFTRYELLKLLGWPDQGWHYRRLSESLRRWVGVTLYYDGCWWDNHRRRRVDASFHILDNVTMFDDDGIRTPSSFAWNKVFFKSCQADNLKQLDLDIYFSLKSAISKQMYRFLDKRFYLRPAWTFDLRELAFEHVGLSRNYTAAKTKEKMRPALEELEGIGFLEAMTAAERYIKVGRGDWNIRVVRKLPPPAEATPAAPETIGLERELVNRGVTRGVAAALVRDYPEGLIRTQVEYVDGTRRKIRDKAAFLVSAIQGNFATKAIARPTKAEPQAVKAESVAVAVADQAGKQRAQTVRAFWEGLTVEDRERIDAEALTQADPALRAEIEGERRPSMRRLRMSVVRDEYLKSLLNVPVVG